MTKLCQGLGLNLANTLARNSKLLAHLFKRARVAILKTKAELNNLTLTISKAVKNLLKLLTKH